MSKVPEKPWTHLMVDFIMKVPVVAGKDAILVVCDRLSKMIHFVATTEETSAEGLARLFRDNVSDVVHTRVKVCRMDSEMSGLVERPWLQLMCCTICLLCSCNFR